MEKRMKCFILINVLLLFLTGVNASCDPVRISYDLCNLDTDCQYAFYIDENGDDYDMFSFLYHRFAAPHSVFVELETLMCSHYNTTTPYVGMTNVTLPYNDLEDFYKLWIVFMNKWHFCEINEYMDSVLKTCVCKQDKNCEFIHPRDMEFHSANYKLLLWIIPIALILVFAVFVRKEKSLIAMIDALRSEH